LNGWYEHDHFKQILLWDNLRPTQNKLLLPQIFQPSKHVPVILFCWG